MKTVKLIERGAITTKSALKQILENPQQHQGCNFAQLRVRNKILDALETADGELVLEDAQHATLKSAVETFVFAVVSPDIESVLDVVFTA